jgi:hypothetical protein
MQRNPEIDQFVRIAEGLLRLHISAGRGKNRNATYYQHLLHVSVLSPPDEVWKPDDGRIPLFGVQHAYDDEKAAPLIAHAISGDADTDAVLSAVAAHYVRNECVLPPRLRDYITRKLENQMTESEPWPKPRTRGRKRNANIRRDFGIASVVSALINGGFPLESGRAQHSASAIVADALTNLGITLDDRSVVRIWKANRKLADCFAKPHLLRFLG